MGSSTKSIWRHIQSLIFIAILHQAIAIVPPSKTFTLVNNGRFSKYTAEFNSKYRALPISSFPFRLCFYSNTINAFTLSIGMGDTNSELGMKWIWDFNRGRPVRENATVSFGQDGNLVLRDSDNTVAWQSGTSNMGVVDLVLQPSGNLVLTDAKGGFVWQSFVFLRDSLLPGQYLLANGRNKLISRVSDIDGSEGPYSFQLKKNSFSFFYQVKGKSLLYYKNEIENVKTIENATITISIDTASEEAYDVTFSGLVLFRPKFNATYSFYRLESSGNLILYSFKHVNTEPWEMTGKLINDESFVGECQLPTICGNLGVCLDNQCVGCPQPQRFLGWRSNCSPPPAPPCKTAAKYYQVPVAVDHFLSGYNDGSTTTLAGCRGKCSSDCGCLGFFYNRNTSKCFVTPFLGSLFQVDDPDHLGFIKTS